MILDPHFGLVLERMLRQQLDDTEHATQLRTALAEDLELPDAAQAGHRLALSRARDQLEHQMRERALLIAALQRDGD